MMVRYNKEIKDNREKDLRMRFDLREMLKDADNGHYAVPAFNFSDIWELRGILKAAEELRAPVIVASNMQVVDEQKPQLLESMCEYFTGISRIPLIFHLDHSRSVDLCRTMIDRGYPSVMFDGSAMPLEENIALCREVSDYAVGKGVCVEAEIGRIIGRNEESNYSEGNYLGTVEDAVRLVQEGRCDSLAVGLGNAHGFYTSRPMLHFDRLAEINEALSIPLVLHGGTGIPEEDIQKAIRNGINKVNVGTELHYTYVTTLKRELSGDDYKPNVFTTMLPVIEAVAEVVKRWIRVCMAEGKA